MASPTGVFISPFDHTNLCSAINGAQMELEKGIPLSDIDYEVKRLQRKYKMRYTCRIDPKDGQFYSYSAMGRWCGIHKEGAV